MRIAVNAVGLRFAGGKSVAFNFLRAVQQQHSGVKLDVFVPGNCGYEQFESDDLIEIHYIPSYLNRLWLRPSIDRFFLAKEIDKIAPDVVFSMGNFALPSQHKQVVLFMWPYATYPDEEIWERMSWFDRRTRQVKIATFRKRLQYASVVAPQTDTSARRLKKYYPEINDVHVIPTAVALPEFSNALSGPRKAFDWSNPRMKLLCLTRYYPHKNLEILIELGRLIKEEKKPFTIITTIAEDHHPGAKKLLRELHRLGLDEVVQNIGPVPMDEVPALYEATDGLLLPTLLESFSGTYVDAMHYNKPVFTSDRDFAHDVCADAAFYFNPMSAPDILSVLEQAYESPATLKEKLQIGSERVRQFPDWNEVARMYLRLLEQTAQ